MISQRTVGRLSLYRRLLNALAAQGTKNVYSHQLAAMAGATAAQVRRDLMAVGYMGTSIRGYDIEELIKSIGSFLDDPQGQSAALVGIGNLGRAILSYFTGRRPNLSIVAAFDVDPGKVGRVINGCRSYPLEELETVTRELDIRLGVLTVPAAAAQSVAESMVRAGIRGILNFAPAPLKMPAGVYVEDIDMTMSLEKVAYYARQGALEHV
jgi:redox-sensing transcriptional repressor